MKLFSVNCQSWKTAKGNFYSIVDDYDIDVLCLTETFESVKEPVKFKQWCKVSRPRKDGYGGVAILYRDDENGVIIQRKQALERDDVEVICVEVTTQRKESFLLVAAYVPPEKKEQLEGLLTVIDKCKKEHKNIIITGDLNSKSLDWNNRKSNTCGNILEEYMHRNGLLCINDGQPTRRNSDSVIDLFLVTPRVIPEVIMFETMTGEAIRSDHIGVLLEVYQSRKESSATREKFIISKAKWDVWRDCTEEKFKEWNEAGKKYGSVDEMAEDFMKVYTECMTEAVPRQEIKMHRSRRNPPWWNEDVKKAKNELNKAKKSFRRRNIPNNLEKLKQCEAQFEKIKEETKETWTKQLCDKITYAGSPKEMWESFNSLTTYQDCGRGGVLPLIDEMNCPVFGREEKCAVLEKVFFGGSHLVNCSFDENFKEEVEDELRDIMEGKIEGDQESSEKCEKFLNHDISMDEIEAAIQHLKKDKSPGPDEVYTEMLKMAGSNFLKAILRLFQMSWKKSEVPVGWKKAEVKFLRKSGKKSYHDPGAYRPISLTSYLCKCLERIITYRLYGFVEHFKILDKEQEGFRKFRGTTDALLRLSQDIFNGFNSKEHTAALFIDVEKAYDSIWRDGLMQKLWGMGITGRMWSWIRNFLTERSAAINMIEWC